MKKAIPRPRRKANTTWRLFHFRTPDGLSHPVKLYHATKVYLIPITKEDAENGIPRNPWFCAMCYAIMQNWALLGLAEKPIYVLAQRGMVYIVTKVNSRGVMVQAIQYCHRTRGFMKDYDDTEAGKTKMLAEWRDDKIVKLKLFPPRASQAGQKSDRPVAPTKPKSQRRTQPTRGAFNRVSLNSIDNEQLKKAYERQYGPKKKGTKE
jgi:hypothetical protein